MLSVPQGSGLVLIDIQNGFITSDTRHVPDQVRLFRNIHLDKFSTTILTKFLTSSPPLRKGIPA